MNIKIGTNVKISRSFSELKITLINKKMAIIYIVINIKYARCH